jgi:hypothetical protein
MTWSKNCTRDGSILPKSKLVWLSTRHASNLSQHELYGVWHKDRPCIQRMIVKVRHNTCFKDVLPIHLSIEVASYSSPHHDWASSKRNSFNNVTLSISSVRLSPNVHFKWTNLLAKHPWSKCCASLWQSSSEYKACLYGWQRQSPQSSRCDRLLAWRVDNHTSMACQESWFKPDLGHLGHYR